MPRLSLMIVAIVVAAIALAADRADAAPQILGLVASNGLPTPLYCRDGICGASLASFCLQETRDAPADGQEYLPAAGKGLTLIVTRQDGARLRLAADGLLTIRMQSGVSTVRVTLPVEKIEAFGLRGDAIRSIAVEVGPETAILPVAAANDPDPQTPAEIAQATGPLRHLAAETFDRSSEMPDAARLVGLMINALPPADETAPVDVAALMNQVLASVGPDRFGPEGLAQAAEIVENCQQFPPTSLAQGFCLESLQHGLLSTLNEQYWEDAGGS